MSMKIITGSTGTTHVTSNNDGEFNEAIYGNGLVVLANGNKLAASIIDNNTIEIADGDLVLQGRHALIEPNTTTRVTIETGAVDYNRIDLIVAHYEMDSSTGYESIDLRAIKGTPTTGAAKAPAITEGVIRTGATVAEAVLYQVKITGVSITEITKIAEESEVLADTIKANKSKIAAVETKVNNAFALITGTLTAGQTSIVLNNSRIKADSVIDPYFYVADGTAIEPISYNTIKVENGKVTMTFDALSYNLNVGIRVI